MPRYIRTNFYFLNGRKNKMADVIFGKSKCPYTGYENLDVNYELGDTVVSTTIKVNDFGLTIRSEPYSVCTLLCN